MKTIARVTLTALTLAASGTPLLAQSPAPTVLAAAVHASPFNAPGAPSTATTRIAHADDLVLRGKISAASREYIAVAKMQLAQNVLPTEALWKLAELHHSHGQSPERTARVLTLLAIEAERLGDPQVQAKALLEAAILYNMASLPGKANECANRLEQLVESPRITDEFRQEVQRRIVRK